MRTPFSRAVESGWWPLPAAIPGVVTIRGRAVAGQVVARNPQTDELLVEMGSAGDLEGGTAPPARYAVYPFEFTPGTRQRRDASQTLLRHSRFCYDDALMGSYGRRAAVVREAMASTLAVTGPCQLQLTELPSGGFMHELGGERVADGEILELLLETGWVGGHYRNELHPETGRPAFEVHVASPAGPAIEHIRIYLPPEALLRRPRDVVGAPSEQSPHEPLAEPVHTEGGGPTASGAAAR